jgi:hypothetical protein
MIKKLISRRPSCCRGLHMAATAGHPDVGDVGSPHLVRPIAKPRSQVGVDAVLRRAAAVLQIGPSASSPSPHQPLYPASG